jgi:malonate decarboxylase epsilon subunit
VSVALLFPGQGAQTEGHLHALPDLVVVREVFDEASETLGFDVLTLDSAEALQSTVAAQVSLLVAGCAFTRFLQSEEVTTAAAAGMSVGAFAAAFAAGALTLCDAVRLVRKRAELMAAAFPDGTHGMAVVEGLRLSQVEALLASDALRLANENSATQFVVAGERRTLERLCVTAVDAGATRAKLLAMSVPSHSDWLANAAEELASFARDVPFGTLQFPVFSNGSARAITQPERLRADLIGNMATPVRWRDVMSALEERGVTLYLEAPPGTTLGGLVAANLPGAQALSAATSRWDVMVYAARKLSS